MDFSLGEEQQALVEVAAQVFAGMATPERVANIERTDDRVDRELWAALAEADLAGVALPERFGGLGFATVELCLVLEQQGRRVAPVPLLPTATAAMALAHFGGEALAGRWVPAVCQGGAVLTAALAEPGANVVDRSSVVANPAGSGWSLRGTKIAVPAAHVADAVLIPAEVPGAGLAVFLVPLADDAVAATRNETTNREIHSSLHLDGVEVGADAVVGPLGGGGEVVGWLWQRIQLGRAAIVLGAGEEALAMTAAYTSQREQFGRPLSTNQGVAMRAADAYIDLQGIRVTLLRAAWRADAGHDAREDVLVAAWWASEAGQRVVHATQHLHGGMGADVDYPVHRYFLWVRQLENHFGAGPQHLAELGALLAARAVRDGATSSYA